MRQVAALPRSSELLVVPLRFLTARSAAASERRLTSLMQQHFDFVWRNLRRLGLSVADADDASQEVFVIASRKLEAIGEGRERSFLFSAALKVASTRRRSLRRRPEQPDTEVEERDEQSAPGPERLAQLSQAREQLQTVLSEMELELRATFVLFELEELSVPQIAELLELPVGTVSSRLRAARGEFQAAVRRLQAREAFAERSK